MKRMIDLLKSFVSVIIEFFKSSFVQTKNKLPKNKLKTNYVPLSPINNVKDCEEHIKALKWAFSNDSIKNIALAGPYGSGKSSIIQTFLQNNRKIRKKSIQVSLATFSNNEDSQPIDLEEGILKQLFYKVQQKDIPQSRYRKIHKISYSRILLFTIISILFVGIFTFIFWPSIWESAQTSVVEAGAKIKLSCEISIGLFIALLIVVLCTLAKIIQVCAFRFSVTDVKLPKEAATVSSNPMETQILNKKIDEIIYFFEETGFRIVFFEDLDRFDNASIFIKLREINTLLNNYDAIKKTVVFVYAIKDEMFNDDERTKFFDFIIPVIPVINSTNSGEKLIELLHIKDGKSTSHDITYEYITDVSPFIADMRLLYNIYNEFLLYKQTIKLNQGLTTLIDSTMLSLIIFKNIQPDQFALLQEEKGLVKEAFKLRSSFINKRKEEIQKEINKHKAILSNIDVDLLNNQYELKYAMLCAITDWKGMTYRISASGYNTISASEILENDFDISRLLENRKYTVSYSTTNGSNTQITISNLHEICAPYAKRLEYLQCSNEEVQHRKQEITSLEIERRNISTQSLQSLISKYGTKNVFGIDKNTDSIEYSENKPLTVAELIVTNDLLEFMLRKGYINEDYANYINFFKGNSLTVGDMNFIMSVKTQKPKGYSYKLSTSQLPNIISRLQPYEFEERAILNFDLLENMLSCHNYDDKLKVFMQQLSNETDDSWRFINEFIDETKQHKRFVEMLVEEWPRMWDHIYDNPVLTYERKAYYMGLLCFYIDVESLCSLNKNGLISKFFVENVDILQKLPDSITDRLIHIIPALNITFIKLDIAGVSPKLLDLIFDNCYYEINSDMIYSVVKYKDDSFCDFLKYKNFTTIKELAYQPLIEYVYENFETYIEQIILQEDNKEESGQSVLEMLDRSISNPDICDRIISHIDFSLDSLCDVCSNHIDENETNVRQIWNALLINNRLKVSWYVIYEYWKSFELTDELCNYIEVNVDVLVNQESECLDDDFKKCIILSEINDSVFEKIIQIIRMDSFTIGLNEISKTKLAIMVNNQNFNFTLEDYNEMYEYVPELCTQFIALNETAYMGLFPEIDLSTPIFESLILNDAVSISTKEKILKYHSIKFMTESVANYLISNSIEIDRDTFASAWKTISATDKKTKLMFRYLGILKLEDFERYFVELDKPYKNFARTPYRHDEIIPDTKLNRALVDKLLRIKYLTSVGYETETRHKREVPVIRCRIKAKQTSPGS